MEFLRPESSVSRAYNEWGEEVFAGDAPGPVIHRTPEELGLERVIAEPKVPEKSEARKRAAMAEAREIERAVERRRRGTASRRRSTAPPAAESKQECSEGETMPPGIYARKTDELREKVLAEPDAPAAELAEKHGVSKAQIYTWRCAARGSAPAKRGRARALAVARTVDVDPGRPGTAAALLGALAKQDAAAATAVRIELTGAELAALFGRLSEEQRSAFLTAGLKAAILS